MSFQQELESLINKHSQENGSNTPDFILAKYMQNCLGAFNEAVQDRELWYGRKPTPAGPVEIEYLSQPGVTNDCAVTRPSFSVDNPDVPTQ